MHELLADKQFTNIVGMDISIRSLELAHRRLKLDRLPSMQRDRIRLIHGALTYRDERLAGFDAAAVVEVIEHLDPARLSAFERVVFQHARPRTVVLTTPNREYNVVWETLPAGAMRHGDHRFEWTRAEFQEWANRVAEQFNYFVRFLPVGLRGQCRWLAVADGSYSIKCLMNDPITWDRSRTIFGNPKPVANVTELKGRLRI